MQILQYRAEGTYLLREEYGTVIEVDLLNHEATVLREVRRAQTEIWLEILDARGDTMGWYIVPSEKVNREHSMYPGPKFMDFSTD